MGKKAQLKRAGGMKSNGQKSATTQPGHPITQGEVIDTEGWTEDQLRTRLCDFGLGVFLSVQFSENMLGEIVLTHIHGGHLMVDENNPVPQHIAQKLQTPAGQNQYVFQTIKQAAENIVTRKFLQSEIPETDHKPLIIPPQ